MLAVTQRLAAPSARGHPLGLLDQRAADAVPPVRRLDEQAVELRVAIVTTQHDREAEQLTDALRDDGATVGDLLERQLDRIGMGEQRLAILFPNQGSAPLQLFETRCARRELRV